MNGLGKIVAGAVSGYLLYKVASTKIVKAYLLKKGVETAYHLIMRKLR